MSNARSLRRAKQKRDIRMAKASNAVDSLGTLTAGAEIFILSFGQFSLLDIISAILHQTGPADVALSTWTAAEFDLDRCKSILDRGGFTSFRVITDRTFFSFKSADRGEKLVHLFGTDNIRTAAIHAKFAVIGNAHWKVALRTSANMNQNPRMENFEVSDDPTLYGFLLQAVDDIFKNHEIGQMQQELPRLDTADTVPRTIQVGKIDTTGLRPARPSK